MANLNEKESRDFVSQVITITDQNADILIEAGYDPNNRSTELKTKMQDTDDAEGAQKKAQAAALDATKLANKTLEEAYKDASAFISLIEGLLGKDHSLVRKLRQLRK